MAETKINIPSLDVMQKPHSALSINQAQVGGVPRAFATNDDVASGAVVVSTDSNGNLVRSFGKNENRNVFETTGPHGNYLRYGRAVDQWETIPLSERQPPKYNPKTKAWEQDTVRMVSLSKQLQSRMQKNKDWRAKLAVSEIFNPYLAERLSYILGDGGTYTNIESQNRTNGFLRSLTETGGVVFPYTPSISVSQQVQYEVTDLVHTNLTLRSYTNTPTPSISVTGKFTANNRIEARYLAAVIHFFRAVVKSDFGKKIYAMNQGMDTHVADSSARDLFRGIPGAPPPILYFSAFGDLIFNEVPVLVESYSFELPDDKDYIEVILNPDNMGNLANTKGLETPYARVPTEMQITVQLAIQPSIERHQREFNLWDFKTGQLLRTRGSELGQYAKNAAGIMVESSGITDKSGNALPRRGGSGWTW